MKNRSSSASSLGVQFLCGLVVALATLGLSSCSQNLYYFPEYKFANRPIPPSQLASRVLASVTTDGSTQGSLAILDGNRDIRGNIQNTTRSFSISGYSGAMPTMILNFPEQLRGYVYSDSDGSVQTLDYGKESSTGSAGMFPGRSTALAISGDFNRIFSAEETLGQFVVIDNSLGRAFALNLPNVYKVASNTSGTVALAMVRNSDTLYRLVKLNINQTFPSNTANPLFPPGAVDCQPYNLPVYCVVPVPGTYDRPVNAYFSLDGTTAYVMNCGRECGGVSSGLTLLQQGALTVTTIPTSAPYTSAVTGTVPVPGGVTTAVSDGTTLYMAGQQLQPDGLFAGRLSTMNLSTLAVSAPVSISDGNHSKMLFADDNTLWIGSQYCATGERAKLGQNYNCLTRYDLGAKTARLIPDVTPGSTTAVVPFPNGDNNPYYYGSLTGLCWVQNMHKVYTAYGGQIHAFRTADGSEINNINVTVQGTALDVAFMDALTNQAN